MSAQEANLAPGVHQDSGQCACLVLFDMDLGGTLWTYLLQFLR